MLPPRRKPLSELTAHELRARAAVLRAMAGTATRKDVQEALLRLADRFARLADNQIQ
jgi:hypothetical protein